MPLDPSMPIQYRIASLLFRVASPGELEARRMLSRLAWPVIRQHITDSGVRMQTPRVSEPVISTLPIGMYNDSYLIETTLNFFSAENWDEAKVWLMPLFDASWPPEIQLLIIEEWHGWVC